MCSFITFIYSILQFVLPLVRDRRMDGSKFQNNLGVFQKGVRSRRNVCCKLAAIVNSAIGSDRVGEISTRQHNHEPIGNPNPGTC